MFALVKARRAKKRQKDSSKHVGEPSKGGCSRPRDMICRQHEFVMGHHRDPTVRYLAIALLTYRRLRPSSRCSQSSVNTGERIFLSTISSTKKRSKHSVSKHLSDALDYSLRWWGKEGGQPSRLHVTLTTGAPRARHSKCNLGPASARG